MRNCWTYKLSLARFNLRPVKIKFISAVELNVNFSYKRYNILILRTEQSKLQFAPL